MAGNSAAVRSGTSPTIAAEFERGGEAAVLELVRQHCGPVVEEADDPAMRRVTFVFADESGAVEAPAVVCAALPNKSTPLRRLRTSSLFAATVELPAEAFVGYAYVLDPPAALLAGEDGGFVQAFAAGLPDPFNPLVDSVNLPQIRFEYEYSVLALDGARRGRVGASAVPPGTFDDWIVASGILGNERRVRVYRPHSYDGQATRYALVFVLGAAEEWWPAAEAFDGLVADGAEPFLGVLVGTRGFVSRHRELAGNDAFVAFAARELLPFLADRYPVHEHGHVVAGASVGAVGAAFLALREPATFSRAGVVSGTFQATPSGSPLPWKAAVGRARPVIDAFERHGGACPERVYVSAGRYETYRRVDMHADAARLASTLARRGVEVRFDEGYTAHDTVALRAYLSTSIAWLLGVDS
jgi:enterochelin esterase-like enzyme